MRITVSALVALNSGNEICVYAEISNGENTERKKLVLLTEQYSLLKIKKGEVSSDQFDEIERASDICSAYKKGLNLLGYGACSEKSLYHKLKTRGFEGDICSEAVAMLSQGGYLNENNDARREAERCIAKLWGRKRIISHLYSKGYNDEAIRDVYDVLSETDFVENCKRLILRDHKRQLASAYADEKEKQRLFASLVRMGYSFSEIKEASAGMTAD